MSGRDPHLTQQHNHNHMCTLLLLLLTFLFRESTMRVIVGSPVTMEIGLLFPFIPTVGTNATSEQIESFSAIIGANMAVQHIQSNTSTNILPITTMLHDTIDIVFHLNDTTIDRIGALEAAAYQTRQSNIIASLVGIFSSAQCVPASFAASTYNMLTPEWVWIGADSVMIELQGKTDANLLNSLAGFIGVVPLVDTTAAPYQRFVDVWQQQNVSDYLSLLPDLPSDIFAHPPAYFQAALSYDIILAYGLAAKSVIDSGQSVTRQSLLTQLHQPNFQFDGITRTNISFDSNGNAAPAYLVMNVQSVNNSTSVLALTQARMNGTAADQLLNTVTGNTILSKVQFASGTALVPSDHDIKLQTTINFLVTGLISARHLPADSTGAICTFLFTNFTLTNSTTAPITKNCTGGMSRRLAYFEGVRASSTNVLAIDVGQSFYPSPYYIVDQGLTIARRMSQMQFDILGLGALDFSLGAATLVQYLHLLQPACVSSDSGTPLQTSGACVVATTLLFPSGSVLSKSLILPYVIKLVAGVKVGFITVQRSDFATSSDSNGEFTLISDQATTLQSTIDQLHQLACHIIILIATSIQPPAKGTLVTLLSQVSGISMVLLYWVETESPLHTYTLMDMNQNIVQVVRVDSAVEDLVHVTVTFDNLSGEPLVAQAAQVRPISLSNGSPEVLTLEIEEADMVVRANAKLNQRITDAPIDIGGVSFGALTTGLVNSTDSFIPVKIDGCRVSQCPTGSLLTDIILTFCTTCSIAHINSGSLRDLIRAGPISLANILSFIPFAPTFSTYEMKGSDLLTVLKYSISKAGAGGYQQWSGIRFAYTIDRKVVANTLADRIILTYTEVMVDGTYQPIESSVTYKLVSIGFTVGGGDGFTMIQSLGRNIYNYALALVDWTVLWLQGGKLATYPLQTRKQLEPCWNVTYTLAQDTTDTNTLVWPDNDCRIISGVQASAVQLCPALQTVVTTTVINTNSSSTNSTSISSCQCISSYERSPINSHTCQHCDLNFVKQFPGDHPCVCDSTHYFIPSFLQGQPIQCIDPTGYTQYPPAADTGNSCKVCPPCIGCGLWDEFGANLTNYAPTAESFDQWSASWFIVSGWWWDGRSNIIYKCPTLSSRSDAVSGCKGTDLNTQQCHTGSTGVLCMQCSSGYSATSHNRCAPCPSQTQSISLFLLSLIAVILFIIFVIYSSFLPRSHSSTVTKILVRHLQTAAFIGGFRISDGDVIHGLTSAMGITNNSGAKALAFECVFHLTAIDLMLISSLILLLLFTLTLAAALSREVRKRWYPTEDDGKVFKVLDARTFLCSCCTSNKVEGDSDEEDEDELELDQLNQLNPLNQNGKMPASKREIKLWSWEQVCLPVCTVIILFLYPSLVLESVRFLVPCLELNGQLLMANDTSISCTSSSYIRMWWIALLRLVLIGFGTPIIMIIRLQAYRRSILKSHDLRSPKSRSFFLRYRFLIEGYTDSAWFWEVVGMARHVSMVLCVVYLTQDDVSQPYIGIWILTIALLLNIYFQPFRREDNPETEEKSMINQSDVTEGKTEPTRKRRRSSIQPRRLSSSMPNNQSSDSPSTKSDNVASGQRFLNLNHLESVSICILITSIIFIALSHADVVRGTSSTTTTAFYMNVTKAIAYGEQQIYSDDSTTTFNSGGSMSTYALILEWTVVIAHMAFILYVLIMGFPHFRTTRYWVSRGSILIQTVKRLSALNAPSKPRHRRTRTNQIEVYSITDIAGSPESSPSFLPISLTSPTISAAPMDPSPSPDFSQKNTPHLTDFTPATNSTALPPLHLHITRQPKRNSHINIPIPTKPLSTPPVQTLIPPYTTKTGDESVSVNVSGTNDLPPSYSYELELTPPAELSRLPSPPSVVSTSTPVTTPSPLSTRFGFERLSPRPIGLSPTHSASSSSLTSLPVSLPIHPSPRSKLYQSLSSRVAQAHQRSQSTQILQPTLPTYPHPSINLMQSPSPPPIPQYPPELEYAGKQDD